MSGPGIQLFTGGDRFTTITPDDHGGILWVASIICAIYVFLSMGLRAYVKREFYGLDDLVALVATVRLPFSQHILFPTTHSSWAYANIFPPFLELLLFSVHC